MFRTLSVVLFFTAFIFSHECLHAQYYAGAGFGTFNIPGASMKFRGFGPTVRFEHVKDKRLGLYLDVSYYSKSVYGGETNLYNVDGVPLGSTPTTDKYSYLYSQLGFKVLLGGDVDQQKVIPFIGGGLTFVLAKQRAMYQSPYHVPDDIYKYTSYGFDFTAGIQYNLNPVVLELRGNLDLDIKPLVDGVSNILTSLRLTVNVPIGQ